MSELVSRCFEPSQPQRIKSGLNTNFNLSPSYSFHKSLYHKSFFFPQPQLKFSTHISEHKTRKNNNTFFFFFSLFIFREHSTREPASSRLTYFILLAYKELVLATANTEKTRERFWKKMQVNGLEV